MILYYAFLNTNYCQFNKYMRALKLKTSNKETSTLTENTVQSLINFKCN